MPDSNIEKNGFTVIELVFAVIVIAIMAAVAAPYLAGGPSAVTVSAMQRKVREDIRYAQSMALSRANLSTPDAANPRFRYRVRFNFPGDPNCPGANQYAIVSDADNNGVWGERPNASGTVESARNPMTGDDYFCVDLGSGEFAGYAVVANFGGSVPGVLEFDNNGVPYDSDGARLASTVTVQLSKDGQNAGINVYPNTGLASAQ